MLNVLPQGFQISGPHCICMHVYVSKCHTPARSRITWSSRGRSENWGILLAHSTKVKSCLSAAWQILVTGSLVWERKKFLYHMTGWNIYFDYLTSATYWVSRTALCVCLRLGFHCKFCIQNLIHRHFFIKAARWFHLIIAFFLPTLPLFLHRCRESRQSNRLKRKCILMNAADTFGKLCTSMQY